MITLKVKDKTYTADGYSLTMGVIEDFVAIIDIDKLGDNLAVAKMAIACFSELKPVVKDIFPDLTDEDYRMVSLKDMKDLILQIGQVIMEDIGEIAVGNLMRA